MSIAEISLLQTPEAFYIEVFTWNFISKTCKDLILCKNTNKGA
jgi:hypothetical protein